VLPELIEKKQEITAGSIEAASHVLMILPVSKTLPDVPGSTELKAAMKRRDLKTAALAKSPVAVQLAGGALVVFTMIEADAGTFETHEQMRKALALLMAEPSTRNR